MLTTDTLFCFEDHLRREGVVRLRIYEHDDHTVVIATDRNRGPSVTNAAEALATQITGAFGIPLHRLIWVEHYPGRDTQALPVSGRTGGDEFDLVTFTWNGARGAWASPVWTYATRDAIERLVGEPLT